MLLILIVLWRGGKNFILMMMLYFDKVIELDVTNLEPSSNLGTNPEMGVSFSNPFPEIKMQ